MTWEGTLQAAGRRWPVVIQWGPGTPFIPPRIYPVGCYSRAHQLLDLSMCLAPPASLDAGWFGVPDLGFWIDQATRWFEGYVGDGWQVGPEEWMTYAAFLPAPEYRPALPATMFIAVPPAWYEVGLAPLGAFNARLPRERRGMGAVTWWRSGDGERREWRAAAALVEGSYDDVPGFWSSMPDPSGRLVAPLSRSAQRCLRREMEKVAARGKPWLDAIFCDLSGEAGDRAWLFSPDPRSATQGLLAVFEPGITQEERLRRHVQVLERFRPWPGARLDRARLEARRVAGKERHMIETISSAHVMLVGLGALGSEVAHLLVREGIARFTLIDGDVLLPENVTRHRADLADAGQPKVEAVRRDILRVNPAAKVDAIVSWIDHLVPAAGWNDARPSLAIGMTGHEGSEHVLGDRCTELLLPCLHAWLEADGRALRLFRAVPHRDPTLLELSRRPQDSIPYLPRGIVPDARTCADSVLPGSAATVHAAANFVARAALDVITGGIAADNHWIFTPDGLSDEDPRLPSALATRYGLASWALPGPGAW